MKNNVAIGVVLALFVLGGGYLALRTHTAPGALVTPGEQHAATTSTPTIPASTSVSVTPVGAATASSKPTVTAGPVTKKVEAAVAHFDHANMVTPERYPTFTGTANVPRVGIALYNSQGVGLVGTDQIVVEDGHWSYSTSVMLSPDTYTIELYGGAKIEKAQLQVK